MNRILPKQPAGDLTAVLDGAIIEEIGWQIEHAYMVGIVMRRWLGAERKRCTLSAASPVRPGARDDASSIAAALTYASCEQMTVSN